jgi:uncharacterized protein (DUF433 family)
LSARGIIWRNVRRNRNLRAIFKCVREFEAERPWITGTGIKVLDVAVRYELMRMTPEEIMLALPHLTLPQVHGALSYYYAHKAELVSSGKPP